MQELSFANLDTVSNNGAGQDSVDYNGPDGGQDPTQWAHGPETIEFRAMVSANAFFSWAAQFTYAASDVYSLLGSAPNDTAGAQAVTDYIYTHNGGNAGFNPDYMGDIIVRGYNSTFGAIPTLDLIPCGLPATCTSSRAIITGKARKRATLRWSALKGTTRHNFKRRWITSTVRHRPRHCLNGQPSTMSRYASTIPVTILGIRPEITSNGIRPQASIWAMVICNPRRSV